MPSILLIEDDNDFRDALARVLTERGYMVMQARDGEEGLRIFHGVAADLVLTDIVMPNMEGVALVTELRRGHPALGIIAMSGGLAHDAPLYLKMAGKLGANRTLKKPFELTALITAIVEVFAETLPADTTG